MSKSDETESLPHEKLIVAAQEELHIYHWSPWTCVTRIFKQVTKEILLYTRSGANNEVFPAQQHHVIMKIVTHILAVFYNLRRNPMDKIIFKITCLLCPVSNCCCISKKWVHCSKFWEARARVLVPFYMSMGLWCKLWTHRGVHYTFNKTSCLTLCKLKCMHQVYKSFKTHKLFKKQDTCESHSPKL